MGDKQSIPLRESRRKVQATLDDRARPTLHGPLLLVTLFLATIPLYPSNNRIFARYVADDAAVAAFLGALFGTCIIVGITLLLYGSWKQNWHGWRPATAAASILGYCASFALLWTALLGGVATVAVAIGAGVGCGLFVAPVIFLWMRCFDMGFRDILFHGAIVCAGSTILTWLISLAPLPLSSAAMMLCTFVGAAAPWFILRRSKCFGGSIRSQEPPLSDAAVSPAPLWAAATSLLSAIWLPLLGFLLTCFMMSAFTRDIGGIINTELVGAAIASLIALAACLLARRTSLVTLVDCLVLPVSMAACLVLGSSPTGSPLFEVGMATVYGPLIFLSLYGLSALIAVVNSDEFPLSIAFGAVFLVASLVLLAGFSFGITVADNELAAGQTIWLLLAVYMAIVLVHLGWRSYRLLAHPSKNTRDEDGASEANLADDAESLAALKSAQITAMAEAANLSKREIEVFDFIARGYNSTYIANSLFISPNTARTHIRNIYRKLGVTSREELLESLNKNV